MLCSLTREAANAARHDAEVMRFEFSNWDITSKAVISAMLGARVSITHDGSPVPLGVAAQATQIAGLKSDYQNFESLEVSPAAIIKRWLMLCSGNSIPVFRWIISKDQVAMLRATLTGSVDLTEVGTYALRSCLSPINF